MKSALQVLVSRGNAAAYLFLLSLVLNAQLVVQPGLDATELSVGILQGEGVVITNATIHGSIEPGYAALAGFSANGVDLVPEQGVILCTGRAELVGDSAGAFLSYMQWPSWGDPDLLALTLQNPVNTAVLEFDFVPEQDVLFFDYVFASEEYPEFVCSFNDGFGFFISGPGLSGPYSNGSINIALVPGTTTPISINTVNNGLENNGDPDDPVCPPVNPDYFVDNTGGDAIAFDGLTIIMTSTAVVVPSETYHIKLVVGDVEDGNYDSAIFIQAQSFRSVSSITAVPDRPGGSARAWVDASGYLFVESKERLGTIHLLDIQGRILRTRMEAASHAKLDLSDLSTGTYLLRTSQGVLRFSK